MRRRDLADAVFGSSLVAGVGRRFVGGARVIAFHGVPDSTRFDRQIAHLKDVWGIADPTTPDTGGRVELTFDDGDVSVVRNGLPVLLRHDVRAVLFVCPGLVVAGAPFWWDTVRDAQGRRDSAEVSRLKQMPDDGRRAALEARDTPVRRDPAELAGRSLNEAELRQWIDAGMLVGNHTWDHPCLDQCSPDEQLRQVTTAHEWLTEFCGAPPSRFAYPNGDWTAETERTLAHLDYDEAFLFDHRIDRTAGEHRLRRSRLRLDAASSPRRSDAVLSGFHSMSLTLRSRVRRTRETGNELTA